MSTAIVFFAQDWVGVVGNAILGVIIITRLHAMHQRSRKVLILLVVIFLAVNIACAVLIGILMRYMSGEEFILSGTYQCAIAYEEDGIYMYTITWILGTIWEVLALCLAVRVAVKHFRELRRHSAGGIIGGCFMVLMRSHVIYFASFVVISSSIFGYALSPVFANILSPGTLIYNGFLQSFTVVWMFVLGPRLILGIREYHAKLVADSDTAADMPSIAFQEHVHVSTSSSV
ncbi:hypothetical protein DFH29DRAFT_1001193 [Suillus ampliporus]|nr:hypothetical protein DFH29DRAFT_1001193 [Suillus ampliporus]